MKDYSNVFELIPIRRNRVKEILDRNGKLTLSEIEQIAHEFDRSVSVIKSDILSIVNGSVFHVNPSMKKRIIARDKGICYICGKKAERPMIEHIIPARAGGKAVESNLAVSCQSCNLKKKTSDSKKYPEKYW